jgi:hypothetical protein
MIETDLNKRKEAAEKEDNEREAIVRGVFHGQTRLVPGEGRGMAASIDQRYSVTDTATGRVFLVYDRRPIPKAELPADIRRQMEEIRVALV